MIFRKPDNMSKLYLFCHIDALLPLKLGDTLIFITKIQEKMVKISQAAFGVSES